MDGFKRPSKPPAVRVRPAEMVNKPFSVDNPPVSTAETAPTSDYRAPVVGDPIKPAKVPFLQRRLYGRSLTIAGSLAILFVSAVHTIGTCYSYAL